MLDGLVEGPLPEQDDIVERLEEWVASTQKKGILFTLEVDANSFSLLPSNEPISTEGIPDGAQSHIKNTLNQFMQLFPDTHRRAIFSTIRSVEFRETAKIESLYHVTPDGQIGSRDREVDWAPPLPTTRSTKESLTLKIVVIVAALALLAGAILFIDFDILWGDVVNLVSPLSIDDIKLECNDLSRYLIVEKIDIQRHGTELNLKIQRNERYPSTYDMYHAEKEAIESGKDLASHLGFEAVVHGLVYAEYYDSNGKLIDAYPIRIRELHSKQSQNVSIPIDRRKRPARVNITF